MRRRTESAGEAVRAVAGRETGGPVVMHLDERDVRAVLRWDGLIAEMESAPPPSPRGRSSNPCGT